MPTYGTDICVGGIASAESEYSASYSASNAFDDNISEFAVWNSAASWAPDDWIKYDLGESVAKVAAQYTIRPYSYGSTVEYYPAAWKFQGSNDDLNWVDIDSQTGQTFSAGTKNTYNSFSNSTAYRYYRWLISATGGGTTYIVINELEIMELSITGVNVPAASIPVTAQIPSYSVPGLPTAEISLVGCSPQSTGKTDIPLAAISLITPLPAFGAPLAYIPSLLLTLLARNPSYIWSVPLSQQISSKVIYRCILTGAADGVSDLEIPISSFQASMRDGDPSYLSCVVPDSNTHEPSITARSNGEIIIQKGIMMMDGTYQMEEIVRVDYESIQVSRGARSDSLIMTGHKTVTSTVSSDRTLTGISFYGVQADGKRRVRADLNLFLRCGDVCIYGVEGGDYFTVGQISYWVQAEPASVYMEVAEA